MDKLYIGKIVKPQGIKGELKVRPESDVPAVFNNIKEVYIDGKPHKVLHFNYRFGFAYLQIDEVNKIEEAEYYRNKKIFVDRKVFDALDENTFLVADLIGMELIDETDKIAGKVENVESHGSADIIIVRADGRAYQVPFIKDVFLKVDKAKRIITISKEQFKAHRIV